jgi:hypothetical protein
MVDGKCKELVDETRRLIVEEVDYTPNVKIYVILLSVNKTFLAMYLLDDGGDGTVELLNSKQLELIQDKFLELN